LDAGPRWVPDTKTDWPTVGRNITLTLTLTWLTKCRSSSPGSVNNFHFSISSRPALGVHPAYPMDMEDSALGEEAGA
jgi:hypothetical protein